MLFIRLIVAWRFMFCFHNLNPSTHWTNWFSWRHSFCCHVHQIVLVGANNHWTNSVCKCNPKVALSGLSPFFLVLFSYCRNLAKKRQKSSFGVLFMLVTSTADVLMDWRFLVLGERWNICYLRSNNRILWGSDITFNYQSWCQSILALFLEVWTNQSWAYNSLGSKPSL